MNAEPVLDAVHVAANTSLVVNFVMHLLGIGALLMLFFVDRAICSRAGETAPPAAC